MDFRGSAPAPAPAPAPGGFSFGASAPSPSYFAHPPGGFRLAPAPAAVTPGQITPETRYDQLPEAVRKNIDQLAAEMKRQRAVADEVRRANHGLELPAQIRKLRRELLDLGNEIQTQNLSLRDLKYDTRRTVKQAEVHGTFVVQRMHSQSGLNTVEQLPSDYMWEMVESFEKRLSVYAQEICAIQEQLSDEPQQGRETAPPPYGQPTRVTPERLALVIREQWKNFYQVAGHAATAHEQIEALRQSYKEKFKDDPFAAAERQERAAERRLLKQMWDQAPPQAALAPAPAVGAPTLGASPWGATPSTFGAPTLVPSPFGAPTPVPSPFGRPAPVAFPFGPPAPTVASPFGHPAPTVASPFGPPAPTVASPFGHPAPTVASPFGPPAPTVASPFGPLAPTVASLFGPPAPAPTFGALGATPAPASSARGTFSTPAPTPAGGLFSPVPAFNVLGIPAAAAPSPTHSFAAPAPAPLTPAWGIPLFNPKTTRKKTKSRNRSSRRAGGS